MRAEEAAQILNRMTSKPGTSVYAWAGRYGTDVHMEYRFEAYESTPDPRTGRVGGSLMRMTSPPITIDASRLKDAEQVRGAGLLALMAVEMHEMCEFWRDENGTAPFHPHNISGKEAYGRLAGIPPEAVTVAYPQPRR